MEMETVPMIKDSLFAIVTLVTLLLETIIVLLVPQDSLDIQLALGNH